MRILRTLAPAFVASAALLSLSLTAAQAGDQSGSNSNSGSNSSYGANAGNSNHHGDGNTSPIFGAPLFAVMNGHHECGMSCNVGDPNGVGSATFLLVRGRGNNNDWVCFGLTATAIDTPTAAHIHHGRAGVSGPIEVTLTAPNNGNPGASSGCVHVSSQIVADIHNNPMDHYVNIHTKKFPEGAIRGQLR